MRIPLFKSWNPHFQPENEALRSPGVVIFASKIYRDKVFLLSFLSAFVSLWQKTASCFLVYCVDNVSDADYYKSEV
jgi:hypothetical protein